MNKKKILYTSLATIALANFSTTVLAEEVGGTSVLEDTTMTALATDAAQLTLYGESGDVLFAGSLEESGFADISELLVSLGYPADATLTNESRGAVASAESGTQWVYSATVLSPTSPSTASSTVAVAPVTLYSESGDVLFAGSLEESGFADMSDLLVSLGYPADATLTNESRGAVASAESGTQWVYSATVIAPKVETVETPTSIANNIGPSSVFSLYSESGELLFSGTLSEYGFSSMSELLVSIGYPTDSEFTQPNGGAVSSADGGTQWVWSWTVVAPKTVETVETPTSIANNIGPSSVFSLYSESGELLFSGTLSEYGFSSMSELLVSIGYPTDSEFTQPNGGAVSSADGGTQWVWSWTVVAPKTEETIARPVEKTPAAGGAAAAGRVEEAKSTTQTSSKSSATTSTAKSESIAKHATGSGQSSSKAEKSLPNTGDSVSIIGMIGLGISALGLIELRRRQA